MVLTKFGKKEKYVAWIEANNAPEFSDRIGIEIGEAIDAVLAKHNIKYNVRVTRV